MRVKQRDVMTVMQKTEMAMVTAVRLLVAKLNPSLTYSALREIGGE